ncbi:MAG: hypothetical protein EA398_11255 [Deltaproteobacteria bacterium]|nr:MAG: hypothetical protein EA398_11255 [Deltaproteobacteria bacterium]
MRSAGSDNRPLRHLLRATLAAAVLALCACDGPLPPADYGDPTLPTAPDEANGIHVQVLAPGALHPIPSAEVEVRLRAFTDDGAPLLVHAEDHPQRLATPAGDPAGEEFALALPLVHGTNRLRLRVREAHGTRSRTVEVRVRYDGDLPGVRPIGLGLDEDCGLARPRATVRETAVCLAAEASTRSGASPHVRVAGAASGPVEAREVAPGRFVAQVTLAEESDAVLTLSATDETGRSAEATLRVRHTRMPPGIRIDDPAVDVVLDDASVRLAGRAEAAGAIRNITVRRGSRAVAMFEGQEDFDLHVPLQPGTNLLTVVAVDDAGNEATETRRVFRDRPITLRGGGRVDGPVMLDLDREALGALVPEEEQRRITLVELELRPLVREALRAIRDPAATGIDPDELGPAERNLRRLLAMDLDTADLAGTRLENLLTVAEGIGLPAPRVLAELLDLSPLEPIADLDIVTDVTLERLVGAHPEVRIERGEALLAISLHDALRDLGPLAERLGPAGEHPGIVDGPVRADLFEPGFRMRVRARSRLERFEGVDVSMGRKDYSQRRPDGPLAEVDFLDPDAFDVIGLVDEPTADMRLRILEAPVFFVAGTGRRENPVPDRPGFFRGGSSVWDEPPWVLEGLIAETAYRIFSHRFAGQGWQRTLRYDAGAIRDAAVLDWDRGWLTIETAGGVGQPPPPGYVWEFLTEVFQVRLHDGGIPEGEAHVAFTLRGVHVGIDADTLVERLRTPLQEQADQLLEAILGTEPLYPDTTDFHFVPAGIDGSPPSLRRLPDAGGFYRDEALSVPATGVERSSDPRRVRAVEGEALHFRARNGEPWTVLVLAVSDDEVSVRVFPAGGMP